MPSAAIPGALWRSLHGIRAGQAVPTMGVTRLVGRPRSSSHRLMRLFFSSPAPRGLCSLNSAGVTSVLERRAARSAASLRCWQDPRHETGVRWGNEVEVDVGSELHALDWTLRWLPGRRGPGVHTWRSNLPGAGARGPGSTACWWPHDDHALRVSKPYSREKLVEGLLRHRYPPMGL